MKTTRATSIRRHVLAALSCAALLAACNTTSGSNLDWIDFTPSTAEVASLRTDGVAIVPKNGEAPVYPSRGYDCYSTPSFRDVIRDARKTGGLVDPGVGQYYDAGTTTRGSNSCGKRITARVIGFRPDPDYTGEFEFYWYGDRKTIRVE